VSCEEQKRLAGKKKSPYLVRALIVRLFYEHHLPDKVYVVAVKFIEIYAGGKILSVKGRFENARV